MLTSDRRFVVSHPFVSIDFASLAPLFLSMCTTVIEFETDNGMFDPHYR